MAKQRFDMLAPDANGTQDVCQALNDLLELIRSAERRCIASSGRARAPALKAELALRAAEHDGDEARLHAAIVLLRCTPHAGETDATLADPLWTTPPLSQPDDDALLRGCIAEEAENATRCEATLRLPGLPAAVRDVIGQCLAAAQRRQRSLQRLLDEG